MFSERRLCAIHAPCLEKIVSLSMPGTRQEEPKGERTEIYGSAQNKLHLYAGESGPRSTNNCTHLFILIIGD